MSTTTKLFESDFKPTDTKKNHYAHLQDQKLSSNVTLYETSATKVENPFWITKQTKPVLLVIQSGGPSLKVKGDALLEEQKQMGPDGKCWMNDPTKKGCTGEAIAWNANLTDNKFGDCLIVLLNMNSPSQQSDVIKEKKFDSITLLSFGEYNTRPENRENLNTMVKALLGVTPGELSGILHLPRGAILIAPGGQVVKSYEIDEVAPAVNATNIFKMLAADLAKIPKPAAVEPVETIRNPAPLSPSMKAGL